MKELAQAYVVEGGQGGIQIKEALALEPLPRPALQRHPNVGGQGGGPPPSPRKKGSLAGWTGLRMDWTERQRCGGGTEMACLGTDWERLCALGNSVSSGWRPGAVGARGTLDLLPWGVMGVAGRRRDSQFLANSNACIQWGSSSLVQRLSWIPASPTAQASCPAGAWTEVPS